MKERCYLARGFGIVKVWYPYLLGASAGLLGTSDGIMVGTHMGREIAWR